MNWLQQFERFVAIATLLRSVLQGAAAASLLLFPTLCTPHEVRKHPPNAWVCSPHRYPGPEVTKKSQGLFRRLSRSCATRTGSPRDLCPPDHVVRAHDGAALTGDELRALPVLAAANKPTPCTIRTSLKLVIAALLPINLQFTYRVSRDASVWCPAEDLTGL